MENSPNQRPRPLRTLWHLLSHRFSGRFQALAWAVFGFMALLSPESFCAIVGTMRGPILIPHSAPAPIAVHTEQGSQNNE